MSSLLFCAPLVFHEPPIPRALTLYGGLLLKAERASEAETVFERMLGTIAPASRLRARVVPIVERADRENVRLSPACRLRTSGAWRLDSVDFAFTVEV